MDLWSACSGWSTEYTVHSTSCSTALWASHLQHHSFTSKIAQLRAWVHHRTPLLELPVELCKDERDVERATKMPERVLLPTVPKSSRLTAINVSREAEAKGFPSRLFPSGQTVSTPNNPIALACASACIHIYTSIPLFKVRTWVSSVSLAMTLPVPVKLTRKRHRVVDMIAAKPGGLTQSPKTPRIS